MDFKSPMMRRMQRARGEKKRYLPRKGRIRFLLMVILAILGLLLSGIFTGKNDNKGKNSKKEKMTPLTEKLFTNEYLATFLKQYPPRYHSSKDTVARGNDTLLFHYSIDTSVQKHARRLFERYKPKYGAVVIMQPVTGRIVGMVSYKRDGVRDIGDNLFCRSIFPAASIYKAITAAAAVEKARMHGKSTIHHTGRNHTLYKYQLEKNLKRFREVPFEDAFAYSINPVFARVGIYFVGGSTLYEYGLKFGFNDSIPFELETETSECFAPESSFALAEMASGFNRRTTLSPLFGALIASAISENGKMPRPYFIDSITSLSDTVRWYKAPESVWREPITSNTAKEVRQMMEKVVKYGTARKSFRYMKRSSRFDHFEYGGKTGSIDKEGIGRVDWFVGFARNPSDENQRLAIGVVTAHDENWTVHSGYLASELLRRRLRSMQIAQEKLRKEQALVHSDSTCDKSDS
jgi:penicillin-binding protein A